jgi:GT2 family glycosyltransferase
MSAPEISIIIVNWNGEGFLAECLRSIVENPPAHAFEIVVVDNASTDGSAEWLKSDECSRMLSGVLFRLIEPGENLGFGRANNLGVASTSAASILVLNPDTVVPDGAIERLHVTLWSDKRIGIVAPKLVFPDGSLQYSVVRLPETPLGIVINGLAVNRIMPRRLFATWLYADNWTYDKRRAVPVVAGAAMMCKREMYDQLGGFDPTIFMYGEDFELCVRVQRAGWKIWFEPDAVIIHASEQSASRRWSEEERAAIQEQAVLDFEQRSFARPINLLNGVARIVVYSIHGWRMKLQGRDSGRVKSLRRINLENCKRIVGGYLGIAQRPIDR